MDGSLLVAFIQTTTLWHFDASEQGPSTTSLRGAQPLRQAQAKKSTPATGMDCFAALAMTADDSVRSD
jgi:hypothetical protein